MEESLLGGDDEGNGSLAISEIDVIRLTFMLDCVMFCIKKIRKYNKALGGLKRGYK